MYMKHIKCLIWILGIAFSPINAQDYSSWSAPIIKDGSILSNPFGGGLNAPQLSEIDLNQDGRQDLFVFDRAGNVVLTYLQSGPMDAPQYEWAPDYAAAFPKLENWVLLRDYNRDGLPDIFAYSDIPGIDGIVVYTSAFNNGNWTFERLDFGPPFNLIQYVNRNGNTLQAYVSRIDYPAVDDIDGDGDLDIVTFDPGGSFVDFYKNMEMEDDLPAGSLVFELADDCWGGFYESGISSAVTFSSSPGECVSLDGADLVATGRHAGSTLLTFDADGDGDKDLVLGDISFDNINLLYNDGTPELAWMNRQNVSFPSLSDPVKVPIFPAAFALETTGDEQIDILVAPNELQNAEDVDVLWQYKANSPGAESPYRLLTKQFLAEDMLDVGTGTHPVFMDYNADGKLDLLVGHISRYTDDGFPISTLHLFENTGTQESPAFQLVDDDYLNLSAFNQTTYGFAPAVGEIDKDGDMDIIIGEQFGSLYLARNEAGPGNPMSFSAVIADFMDIDVGLASVPFLYDLNEDGYDDLLVGERTGNVNLFTHTGNTENPYHNDLSADGNTANLGQINTRLPGFLNGYSAPVVVASTQGPLLVTGSEEGNLLLYGEVINNRFGVMPELNDHLGNLNVGSRTRPALADLDNDGFFDLVTGNLRGGLTLHRTDIRVDQTTSIKNNFTETLDFEVYPNPVQDQLHVTWRSFAGQQVTMEVWNAQGQKIHYLETDGTQQQISVSDWTAGLYVLRAYSGRAMAAKWFSVQ